MENETISELFMEKYASCWDKLYESDGLTFFVEWASFREWKLIEETLNEISRRDPERRKGPRVPELIKVYAEIKKRHSPTEMLGGTCNACKNCGKVQLVTTGGGVPERLMAPENPEPLNARYLYMAEGYCYCRYGESRSNNLDKIYRQKHVKHSFGPACDGESRFKADDFIEECHKLWKNKRG